MRLFPYRSRFLSAVVCEKVIKRWYFYTIISLHFFHRHRHGSLDASNELNCQMRQFFPENILYYIPAPFCDFALIIMIELENHIY